MILHNILIIGYTWLITNVILCIILAIVSFILGVKTGSDEEFALKIKAEWLKDCNEKLRLYYEMPVSIQWLLLPIPFIVDIGIGLYYIFN